jgi:hypothetical protein
MAQSKPYLLPNTAGRYVTETLTNTSGSIFRVDGSKTVYADYFIENGNLILETSAFASPEFQRNLAQNSQGYNRTISNSILEATGTAPSGNTAQNNPNDSGSPDSSQPTTSPPNNKQPVTAPPGLIYPTDLGSSDQDKIRFWAAEYVTGKSRGLSGSGVPSLSSVVGAKVEVPVFLPIQSAISDQNAVGWEPDTLNPIELYAVNASLDVMEAGSMENVTKVSADNLNTALQRLRSSSREVRTYLAGQAVGVNNLLSRLQGQVLNPNLELLFQGPQLRPFSFTFKLSARNDIETKTIKQIINYFKKYMAPRYKDGDLFIRAPHIFEIKYLYKNKEDHPGLNLIKACALTNFSVDYTPLGSYMTYEDGTMVAYTLSMQFQELTPIYENDYDGHDIGY